MKKRMNALLSAFGGLVMFAVLLVPWRAGAEEVNSEAQALLTELEAYRHTIVYETFRDDNWELYVVNADGSEPVNLTNTPDVNELYPHVSPDGTKVCFLVDEGEGNAMVRSVWYMNMDGTDRTLVAEFARQPCWSPDGTAIAFLGDEGNPPAVKDGQLVPGANDEYQFTYLDYATVGIFFYDLKTGAYRQHPNKDIHHLYN
ncbi:MAG: hypothetical protein GY851_24295, partial [bacterium]|nr:hypothetical protein [bacterium]